jgi:hypothetical protein
MRHTFFSLTQIEEAVVLLKRWSEAHPDVDFAECGVIIHNYGQPTFPYEFTLCRDLLGMQVKAFPVDARTEGKLPIMSTMVFAWEAIHAAETEGYQHVVADIGSDIEHLDQITGLFESVEMTAALMMQLNGEQPLNLDAPLIGSAEWSKELVPHEQVVEEFPEAIAWAFAQKYSRYIKHDSTNWPPIKEACEKYDIAKNGTWRETIPALAAVEAEAFLNKARTDIATFIADQQEEAAIEAGE